MKTKAKAKNIVAFAITAIVLAIVAIIGARQVVQSRRYESILDAQDVYFMIGGFDSGYTEYSISADDYVLHYAPTDYWDVRYSQQWDEEKYYDFLQDIADAGVARWREGYSNSLILDGTQWNLTIGTKSEHIESGGSNAYPLSFDKLQSVILEHCDVEYVTYGDIAEYTSDVRLIVDDDSRGYREYSIDKGGTSFTIDGQQYSQQWTQSEYDSFCRSLAFAGVHTWREQYQGTVNTREIEWEIALAGEYGVVSSYGTDDTPIGFDELIYVIDSYCQSETAVDDGIVATATSLVFEGGNQQESCVLYTITTNDYLLRYRPDTKVKIEYTEQWNEEKFRCMIQELVDIGLTTWDDRYYGDTMDEYFYSVTLYCEDDTIRSTAYDSAHSNYYAVLDGYCTIDD